MAETVRARSPGFLGHEFNDFLFAPVGADRNGGNLSVVSALARMNLDPWAEAGKLAKLPEDIATQKLSLLIAELQEIPSARQESTKIAARLIALLPIALNVSGRPTVSSASVRKMTNSQSAFSIFLCALALILAVQVVMHSIQPPASRPVSHIASNPPNSDTSAKAPSPSD